MGDIVYFSLLRISKRVLRWLHLVVTLFEMRGAKRSLRHAESTVTEFCWQGRWLLMCERKRVLTCKRCSGLVMADSSHTLSAFRAYLIAVDRSFPDTIHPCQGQYDSNWLLLKCIDNHALSGSNKALAFTCTQRRHCRQGAIKPSSFLWQYACLGCRLALLDFRCCYWILEFNNAHHDFWHAPETTHCVQLANSNNREAQSPSLIALKGKFSRMVQRTSRLDSV